ncbi:RAD52 motif-containing protein 1 isoform X3 [Moschus berezovskii]|uniref:RAD52 motif-containing protein 1 isoform X3 n=1 Tax=Moschus berezovskii TaxID=68408 RepID=UPI002443D480|nr:RAD52 motif-containing protein 1 isoform X3 [Moschus berezovskii]
MAELVPFAVPTGSDKTLLVWELSSGPTAEALQLSLFTVFSQFGLLYSVRVFPNAAVAGPGFYAIIKFYSARDAHRAQKACNQKQLFQKSPVKLQDISDPKEERENEDIVAPLQKQSLKFFCALEVVLPSYECRSPGVGMAEEPLDNLEEDLGPLSLLMKRKKTQKLAIQKAMTDAFQKLQIVVLESGKIAVAYRSCEEVTDARTEEELQDLIQVSCFSWKPCGQREEECLSDFSFEEFTVPELD